MANLPDISTESNLPSEDNNHDDDELDPRVQVCLLIVESFLGTMKNI